VYNSQTKVLPREWLAITAVIFLFLALTLIAHLSPFVSDNSEVGEPHYLVPKEVEIFVTGAVEDPGIYRLPQGSTQKDLLTKIKPKPNADLRKLKGRAKLYNGQEIEIAELPLITVYLEGEVENPGPIHISEGSSLQDLMKEIRFKPGADKAKIQKKRKLKDQETIVVKPLKQKTKPK
jgi:hypothetical protein